MPPREMGNRSADGPQHATAGADNVQAPALPPAPGARGGATGALIMWLKMVCQSSPGLALFAVWFVVFALVAWGTHLVARTCEANGERSNVLRGYQFSERDQAHTLKSTD
jgi:hypothetical protein